MHTFRCGYNFIVFDLAARLSLRTFFFVQSFLFLVVLRIQFTAYFIYVLYVDADVQRISRTLVARFVFTVRLKRLCDKHKTFANVNIHIMLWKCTRQVSVVDEIGGTH